MSQSDVLISILLSDISKLLLKELHPTPAVCGFPATSGLEFIRRYETSSFDRGMYAGPFGFIGRDYADVVVAIRSGLLSQNRNERERSTLSIYAGAGVVQGSTAQGEWSETSYKLGVLSSFFAQSPLSFNSFPTANEAWAAAFIEELIRSGVTQFYICPGSRSTPLTAALSRAMRIHVGVVECTSVHGKCICQLYIILVGLIAKPTFCFTFKQDERAAAFRALGFARSTGQIAAVVTSSGTAVANLYPAVVESSMDGIPMILLTADRPYESRDIGANQAIDQLKVSPYF
jgi:isochorismate synthase/2-succinyl-5-enolpyruvyl-6-hydroxy-3-cyclohexene-1-carboxylate synthase/2-succinyl-6-hydroxy-2,4-cyclohexadiene-1-carboxylate synthase/O-succinylbenzoate synthase